LEGKQLRSDSILYSYISCKIPWRKRYDLAYVHFLTDSCVK